MTILEDGAVDDAPVPSGGGMAPRRRTLGDEVKRRRSELGLSQVALARQGMVSLATLGAIERGDRGSFQGTTLARLDRALGWTVGTAQGLLNAEHADTAAAELPAGLRHALEDLRDTVVHEVQAAAERRRSGDDELVDMIGRLDPAERAQVIALVQFLLNHRPRSR